MSTDCSSPCPTVTSPCPQPELLTRFAQGLLPFDEAEELERHLTGCSHCAERLDAAGMAEEDDLLRCLPVAGSHVGAVETDPVLERLMVSLCELGGALSSETEPASQATTAVHGGFHHQAAKDLLCHLGPPREAGDLGSLGRFRLLSVVGAGGMGVVFRALDPALGRVVALKSLHSGLLWSPSLRQRFVREGRAAAAIRNRYVVAAHEVGEVGELLYIASDYCPGATVAQWLKGHPEPIEAPAAARIVAMLADGVAAAHRVGVLHRDIKPGNIILEDVSPQSSAAETPLSSLEPRLTDFGLARFEQLPEHRTQTGVILGTPAYMAPEQFDASAGDVGPPTDVYALGAVLYELLVHRPPFVEETQAALLQAVLLQEPRRLRSLRKGLPRDLEAIVLRCLEKSPHKRYPTAEALEADLQRFLAGDATIARPGTLPGRAVRWCRKRPAIAGLWTAVVTAIIAIVLLSVHFAYSQMRDRARLEFERGLSLCEQGELEQGMLRLAESLSLAQASGSTDLARVIRTNLWSWRHDLRPLTFMFSHNGLIKNADVSADGKLLVTAGDDGTVSAWNATDGRRLWQINCGFLVHALAIRNKAGEVLVAGGDDQGAVATIRASDGQVLRQVAFPATVSVVAVAEATDRVVLILSEGNSLVLQAGDLSEVREMHQSALGRCLAVSPDGTLCAIGRDDEVGLWELASGRLLWTVKREAAVISAAIAQADGDPSSLRVIAGGRDRKLQVLDENGTVVREQELLGYLLSLDVSSDGDRVLVACSDRAAHLLNLTTGKPTERMLRHPSWVTWSAFVGDRDAIITLSRDGLVRLYGPRPDRRARSSILHGAGLRSADWSADGKHVATGGSDHVARVWNLETGRAIALEHTGTVWDLQFSSDGTTLLTGELAVRSEERAFVVHWDVASGRRIDAVALGANKLARVAFRPDCTEFAVAEAPGIGPHCAVSIFTISPDGEIAPRPRRQLSHAAVVWDIAFHPEKNLLATGCFDGRVRLWNSSSGERIPWEARLGEANWALAVQHQPPHGERIATGALDGAIQLWDSRTGEMIGRTMRHSLSCEALRFSHDGAMLLSGSADGGCRLWDVDTQFPLGPSLGRGQIVLRVDFAPGDDAYLAASEDGMVEFWKTPVPIQGDADEIRNWVSAITGARLDEHDSVITLNAEEWRQRTLGFAAAELGLE